MNGITLTIATTFLLFFHHTNAGLGGLGGITVKDPECDEILDNPKYGGKRCTLRDISTRRTSYNWHILTQPELVFIDTIMFYIPLDFQMQMGSFEMINLTSVELHFIEKSNFELGHKLSQLYLPWNQLNEISDETFVGTPELRILDLSDNMIEHIDSKAFSNLTQLLHLDLHGNHIRNIDFSLFKDLVALEHLDIGYNDVTEIDVTDLNKYLPKLEWIGLKGTKMECSEMKIIGQKLQEFSVLTDVIDASTGEVVSDAGCIMPEMAEMWFD